MAITVAVVKGGLRIVSSAAQDTTAIQWGIEWLVKGKSHQISGGSYKMYDRKTNKTISVRNAPIVYSRVSPVRVVETGNTYQHATALGNELSQAKGRLIGRVIASEAYSGDNSTPVEVSAALKMLRDAATYVVPAMSMD